MYLYIVISKKIVWQIKTLERKQIPNKHTEKIFCAKNTEVPSMNLPKKLSVNDFFDNKFIVIELRQEGCKNIVNTMLKMESDIQRADHVPVAALLMNKSNYHAVSLLFVIMMALQL